MSRLLSQQAEAALWAIANIDLVATPPDFAILRVPSIVENYVDGILEELTAEYLAGETVFQDNLAQIAQERLHGSWASRREWLREAFQVSIEGRPEDQSLLLLVQLRNSIAHGASSLTRLQQKKLNEQLALERSFRDRLAVSVDGYRIGCTPQTALIAVRVGSEYIRALDGQVVPVLMKRGLLR